MNVIEYDNKKLIAFYMENGLEFDETKSYFGTNVKSFAVLENEKIIGAVSISIYKNKNFIEALAVDKRYRNKGYGTMLLKKVLGQVDLPIYTISKADEFYIKNGFCYDDADLIDKECETCKKYNVTCFPKVMKYSTNIQNII